MRRATEGNSMNRATLPVALLLAALPAAAAEILTLDQAVALALENNRNLQSTALDVAKAQDRLAATRTRQFPGINLYVLGAQQLRSFDFQLTKGVLGDYSGTGPVPSEDVHLKTPLQPTAVVVGRVVQPLTSLIKIRRSMDTLKTGVKLAEEQTRADRQKITREVKRVYYSLQQVGATLRSVRETTRLYLEVEKLTSNYVVQQVALRGDLLETQTRVARNVQYEAQLGNQEATAKEQLNLLLGRDVLTEFEVQPILEASGDEPTLVAARARAISVRPEIRQAELRVKQAEQDLRAKKAEYIPEVSAEFNNLSFVNWGQYMPSQSTSVGVSLTWEPFDWGRKKHESAEKQRSIDQAALARREAENQVLADVNDKYRQLQYRRGELRVARLAQETALEGLRVVNNKYAVQAVLLKDVLQAQAGLEQTNSDYQQTLTSFWNARADFERALGEDK
jgi:outer membrane protein TolC